MSAVLSTYRLQLHREFGLADARAQLPYLARLGVTHLYLSPVLRARRGSTHGYDVVDPTAVNPEIGGEDELDRLAAAAREHGLGLVLDIVPNHMATGPENPFWEDVLMHGLASEHAGWFDIDWGPEDGPPRRIFVPVLGDRIGTVIARGELRVTASDAGLRLAYFDESFPIDPGTLPIVLDPGLGPLRNRLGRADPDLREMESVLSALRSLPPRTAPDVAGVRGERARRAAEALERLRELRSRAPAIAELVRERVDSLRPDAGGARRLRRLVAAQAYRLAYWRRGAREINYRRFFTLSHLVSLRQEDSAVFEATHARILDWVGERKIDGLRIDHIDGLYDPVGYLRRLRAEIEERLPRPEAERFLLFVEKILARDEHLGRDWPVAGTTGYEFMNELEDLFIEPDGLERIEDAYARFIGRSLSFERIARSSQRQVLLDQLGADVRRLARRLSGLQVHDGSKRPPVTAALAGAIRETIAALPVYRTYVRDESPFYGDEDRHHLERAIETARSIGRAHPSALDRLGHALLLEGADRIDDRRLRATIRFVRRFQQLSGPAAAKGVEDRAFYVYVPLLSRNEVGNEPDRPVEAAREGMHRANRERAERWPRAMLSASTHDTKRSADVRARLDVLTEVPELWRRRLARWQRWNAPHRRRVRGRRFPDRNMEYMLYQTVVGVWPYPHGAGAEVPDELADRVAAYMEKAAREAAIHTRWTELNEQYEEALQSFTRALLSRAASARFLDDLDDLVARVAPAGFWNAISRSLIQVTSPGIPDLYQGDEMWNFSLVDPDNRRPVDYDRRRDALGDVEAAFDVAGAAAAEVLADLRSTPEDGRLKARVLNRGLRARRDHSELFVGGDYLPLTVEGPAADRVFAFERRAGPRRALTIAGRFFMAESAEEGGSKIGQAVIGGAWSGNHLALLDDATAPGWRCLLSGQRLDRERGRVPLESAFAHLPVALLLSE